MRAEATKSRQQLENEVSRTLVRIENLFLGRAPSHLTGECVIVITPDGKLESLTAMKRRMRS